jgi:hypothetical protein
MVILGFLMVAGRDFEATFAPTAAPTSIRLLAVLASRLRYVVKVGDVETAFLVPKMDKVVYVKALLWYEQIVAELSGLPVPTDLHPDSCRQLLKGVPGIKQGSRLFYLEIKRVLLSLGFIVHPADPCVYIRLPSSSIAFAAIAVWVDDVFAVVESDADWSSILDGLRASFTISDKGDVKMFLGMEISQNADRSVITFSQRISIDNLLSRAQASMKSQHPAVTPCVAGFVFTKGDCPTIALARPVRMPEFRGLIALANYISVWTRPDITFVVNKLCKYMANPGNRHIDVFERLLRYLATTRELGLVYVFDASAPPLVAYSDSSHMDCVDTSRSTLAYLFFCFGQVVSWYSKLHTFVTTCSNHSEYAAMFQAAKEAQSILNWLSPMLSFLRVEVVPIPIFNDNDGASALALDPVGRFKNKHVRMEHHYTQELVTAKIIVPVRVDTSENKSDLLTKALGPTVFPSIALSLVGPVHSSPELHRVLMFRAVDDAPTTTFRVRDFAVFRVHDVGTQCEFKTRDVSTQCNSGTNDVGCQCSFDEGGPDDPSGARADLQDAWQVVMRFSQDACAFAESLLMRQQNLQDAIDAHEARVEALRPVRSPLEDVVRRVEPARPVSPRPGAPPDSAGYLRSGAAMPHAAVARSPRESIANSRARRNYDNVSVSPPPMFCYYCQKRGHDITRCRSYGKRVDKSLKRRR